MHTRGIQRLFSPACRLSPEDSRRGIVFIMALIISATVMAIALALATIIIGELRISADVGYYVPAFYAADAGAERALYCERNGLSCSQNPGASYCRANATFCSEEVTLGDNALYFYEVDNKGINGCTASNVCIFSTGKFNGTARTIEVSY